MGLLDDAGAGVAPETGGSLLDAAGAGVAPEPKLYQGEVEKHAGPSPYEKTMSGLGEDIQPGLANIPRNALTEAGGIAQGLGVVGSLAVQRLGEAFPQHLPRNRAETVGFLPSLFTGPLIGGPAGQKPLLRPFRLNPNEPSDLESLGKMGRSVASDYNQRYVKPGFRYVKDMSEAAGAASAGDSQEAQRKLKEAGNEARYAADEATKRPLSTVLDLSGIGAGAVAGKVGGAAGKVAAKAAALGLEDVTPDMVAAAAKQAIKGTGKLTTRPGAGTMAAGIQAQKTAGFQLPPQLADLIPGTHEHRIRHEMREELKMADSKLRDQLTGIAKELQASYDKVPEAERAALVKGGAMARPASFSPEARAYLSKVRELNEAMAKRLVGSGRVTADEVETAKWGELAMRLSQNPASNLAKTVGPIARADEMLQAGKLTPKGQQAIAAAKSFVKKNKLDEPTYFGMVHKEQLERFFAGMHNPIAGVGRMVRKGLEDSLNPNAPEMTPHFNARQLGTRSTSYSEDALKLPIMRAAQTLQMFTTQEIIERAIQHALPANAAGVQFPLRQYLSELAMATGTGDENMAQVISRQPLNINLPAGIARELNDVLGASMNEAKNALDEFADSKIGRFNWWLRNNQLSFMLGTNPAWVWMISLQQMLGAETAMWRGPQDIVPSMLAHGIAFNPLNSVKLPTRFFNPMGEEVSEAKAVTQATSRWHAIESGYVDGRNRLVRPAFNAQNAADNKSRELLATYLIMREGLNAQGKVGVMARSALDMQAAMSLVEHGAADAATVSKVAHQVEDWLGDYSKLTLQDQRAIRGILPFFAFYHHVGTMVSRSITDTPMKTAILTTLQENMSPLFQDPDMSRQFKREGAVYQRDDKGEPKTTPEGARLVTMRPDFMPWSMMVSWVLQAKARASGGKEPVENLPMSPAIEGGIYAMGIPYNYGTGREFKESDLVQSRGHQFDPEDLQKEGELGDVRSQPPPDTEAARLWFGPRDAGWMQKMRFPGIRPSGLTPILSAGRANPARGDEGQPLTYGSPLDYAREFIGVGGIPLRTTADEEEARNELMRRNALRSAAREGFPRAPIETLYDSAINSAKMTLKSFLDKADLRGGK